MSRGGCSRTPS
eukprot:gene27217-biopygen17754